jgi:hypothetical protein
MKENRNTVMIRGNEVANKRKAYIYYIHSKGGCCVRGEKKVSYNVEPVGKTNELLHFWCWYVVHSYVNNVLYIYIYVYIYMYIYQFYIFLYTASWREGMNTFNLEFPSICLRALLAGTLVVWFYVIQSITFHSIII